MAKRFKGTAIDKKAAMELLATFAKALGLEPKTEKVKAHEPKTEVKKFVRSPEARDERVDAGYAEEAKRFLRVDERGLPTLVANPFDVGEFTKMVALHRFGLRPVWGEPVPFMGKMVRPVRWNEAPKSLRSEGNVVQVTSKRTPPAAKATAPRPYATTAPVMDTPVAEAEKVAVAAHLPPERRTTPDGKPESDSSYAAYLRYWAEVERGMAEKWQGYLARCFCGFYGDKYSVATAATLCGYPHHGTYSSAAGRDRENGEAKLFYSQLHRCGVLSKDGQKAMTFKKAA